VPIERAKIDSLRGAAGRTAHPQEPVSASDRGADRWRKQHRHPVGLPLVPSGDQALGILEDPRFEFPARLGFLPGDVGPLIFHLALVEAHGRIVAVNVRFSAQSGLSVGDAECPLRAKGRNSTVRNNCQELGSTTVALISVASNT
jgi:hypothetical protein